MNHSSYMIVQIKVLPHSPTLGPRTSYVVTEFICPGEGSTTHVFWFYEDSTGSFRTLSKCRHSFVSVPGQESPSQMMSSVYSFVVSVVSVWRSYQTPFLGKTFELRGHNHTNVLLIFFFFPVVESWQHSNTPDSFRHIIHESSTLTSRIMCNQERKGTRNYLQHNWWKLRRSVKTCLTEYSLLSVTLCCPWGKYFWFSDSVSGFDGEGAREGRSGDRDRSVPPRVWSGD